VSRTIVFDLPRNGRAFFEALVADNLDLGRPEQVELIFGRTILPTTPGVFATRVVTAASMSVSTSATSTPAPRSCAAAATSRSSVLLRLIDIGMAAVAAALALIESLIYGPIPGTDATVGSTVLTTTAALSVTDAVRHRSFPRWSALWRSWPARC
jgi:hypothetical protein